ncbi:MAG: transcriptional repressor [Clostridiales bacterium]|nr:transcriptional repressor [Clostridiales bacterium]
MRKYSRQREIVLDILQKSYSHPTAEEVFTEARKVDSNISLGTVYRNLELLCSDRVIEKIPTPISKDRFDLKKSKHNHAICERCGKVLDFESKVDLQSIKSEIEKDSGFEIIQDEIRVIGICSECNKKN